MPGVRNPLLAGALGPDKTRYCASAGAAAGSRKREAATVAVRKIRQRRRALNLLLLLDSCDQLRIAKDAYVMSDEDGAIIPVEFLYGYRQKAEQRDETARAGQALPSDCTISAPRFPKIPRTSRSDKLGRMRKASS